MPTSEVDKLTQLSMGGTPDRAVLSWAWTEIKRQAHGDEKPVIVMASDGWGYGGWDSNGSLASVVVTANKHGVEVRSVAIGNIDTDMQLETYGRGNFIPWQGSIIETARPLGMMLTSLAAPKIQR